MNKRYRFAAFAGIVVLTGALTGWTAAPTHSAGLLRVPPMAAPVLDGRQTSDAEWLSACQLAGWADPVLGVANGDGTQVSVGHADGILYARFTCPIPEKFRLNKVVYASFALKMTAKDKDGDILQDDYVGVYLRPPGKQEVYFLGVNGAGTTRDSRSGDVSWNGQWQAQQSLDDFFWTVEISIPLSQFGGAVADDQAWGVNFAHGARNIELLESRWAYQPAALYPMAEMRLSARAVAVALTGLGTLSEGSLALKGQVANLSKEPFNGTVEVTVCDVVDTNKPAFGPEKTALALNPGEQMDIAAGFDAGKPLCGKVMVTVRSLGAAALPRPAGAEDKTGAGSRAAPGDNQDVVWLDYSLPFVFAREISLETRWIPTPSILQVVLDLGSPASFKKVTGGKVTLTSLESKKVVLTQALPAFQSSLSISDIGCTKLPIGRYEATVELMRAMPSAQPEASPHLDKEGVSEGRARRPAEPHAVMATLRSEFVKEPDPEWLGNTIGISDKVPIPWTPLKAEGGKSGWLSAFSAKPLTVSCWGRRYTFGPAGFPSQINVLGQDILAGPVRILVQRGGRTEVLPAGICRVTDRKEARIAFKSVAKTGGLEITAETWIEFDGFVWNTIRIQPDRSWRGRRHPSPGPADAGPTSPSGGEVSGLPLPLRERGGVRGSSGQPDAPVEVEGLSIEIPLKKEYATLWWHPALCAGMLTDKMGAPPQQPFAGAPLNFLRLGDEEHGIQFFYESLRNWNPVPGKGQELIPGEKEYVLRYNLIGQTTKVDKPIEFVLGYMALPCKPRGNLFRRIDANSMWSGSPSGLGKAETERRNWLWWTYTYGAWTGRGECNYINFWNPEVFAPDYLQKFKEKNDSEWEKNRRALCLYYQGGTTDANSPEYRTYRFEWKPVPGNAPYVPPDPKTRDKLVFGSVCHNSRSYREFYAWCLDKALRYVSDNGKIPVSGYQDCGGMFLCMNALHGCPADGSTAVLADREWSKRIYTIFKSISSLNQLYVHTGGVSVMSSHSFFDMMLEGEQFTAAYLAAIVNDPALPKDYTKLLSLDRYRAQCQPYAWGPDRYYLTQFWQWMEKEPDEARAAVGHLWGLSLCHDTPDWGCVMPACVSRAISEVQWDDTVEFIPYWRKQTGIEVKAPVGPVVASGWRCGPTNLLVIVMNDGDQAAKGELKIDFARFGFKPEEVKCRDYGNAGLAYPNALFCKQNKTTFDPQQLPVQDAVIQAGAAVSVDLGRHSFKLIRFYQ